MLKKKGTPEPIKQVVNGDHEFEKLKKKIAADNNLKRCACGQLLAKFDSDNKIINLQKKKLDMIAEVSSASIRCSSCGNINNIL